MRLIAKSKPKSGLPDGLFSNQISQFWVNFRGSCNGKSIGIFYDHLIYLTAIENILWSFGIFFPPFWYFWYYQEKSGNPDPNAYFKNDL
jgi:hypothetical protein